MAEVKPCSVFIISLDKDIERRNTILRQINGFSKFSAKIIKGVDGIRLSDNVCVALTRDANWAKFKGTIGCFLSHVKAWEEVSKLTDDYAIVLEDDVNVELLHNIHQISISKDADIVFLNDRMSPNILNADIPHLLPLSHALKNLELAHSGPGGDGYLITPSAAAKMLHACLTDLYYGHVDGRILRYATNEDDLADLPDNSWIAGVIRNHHHPKLPPRLGLLRSYCLSQPFVSHRGVPSSREAGDAPTNLVRAERNPHQTMASIETDNPINSERMLPIRYWNRVKNIGDLINPYVFESISSSRPYFAVNEHAEHILGIGSIFFMANQNSHIWGSGILDPQADVTSIDLQKVHAVRGKLTLEVLRKKRGFDREIYLGDPGIFITELPEVLEFKKTLTIKQKTILIPHYTSIKNEGIIDFAKSVDATIISPRTASLEFIKAILESELVISQSLHGLIFAEVLGKPSVWVSLVNSEKWNFKFNDWYSTTFDPPKEPFLLNSSPHEVLASAHISGLNVDVEGLRGSLPRVLSNGRLPGIGFRTCRQLAPLNIYVTDNTAADDEDFYDHVLLCERGNDEKLRLALNTYSLRFDESISLMVVFDHNYYMSAKLAEINRARDLFTDLPNLHFIALLPIQLRKDDQSYGGGKHNDGIFALDLWNSSFRWQGAVLIRNPINFTFAAPGIAAFREPK